MLITVCWSLVLRFMVRNKYLVKFQAIFLFSFNAVELNLSCIFHHSLFLYVWLNNSGTKNGHRLYGMRSRKTHWNNAPIAKWNRNKLIWPNDFFLFASFLFFCHYFLCIVCAFVAKIECTIQFCLSSLQLKEKQEEIIR